MKQADFLSGVRTMAKGIIPIVILVVSVLFPSGYAATAVPVTVTIVHTSSVNGHLFACPS
jgi:hypothetical protein